MYTIRLLQIGVGSGASKTQSSGGGLILAFDPTKSPQYKVIYVEAGVRRHKLHTFSSETGNWSLSKHKFPVGSFDRFEFGVYWNDAIYWPDGDGKIFKLDIMNEDHPVLTLLSVDEKVHLCSPYESRGRLLAFCMEDERYRDFSIYEKRNVDSEWSVKYVVNLDHIIYPFREMWRPFCIVLGETEEDSFLVMALDKKVVQYKIMSNTLSTIYDLGRDRYNFLNCFHVIPSFANV